MSMRRYSSQVRRGIYRIPGDPKRICMACECCGARQPSRLQNKHKCVDCGRYLCAGCAETVDGLRLCGPCATERKAAEG